MRILISGGAGFVGSSLALQYQKKYPKAEIIAFDNLHRRGSELNLPEFQRLGIQFWHGDIRSLSDLQELPGNFDLFIEASAEPSVLAGVANSPEYVLQTNLLGTINALEFARKRCSCFVFLSTSRVFSVAALKAIRLDEEKTRFVLSDQQDIAGLSAAGIAEDFPKDTARSFYGTSKLASEMLIQEYAESYQLPSIINRCGVIAGPGQFGKVDQGVFTLWIAKHYFGGSLQYTGFGGQGKQVRDLLHPVDLFFLLEKQIPIAKKIAGTIFNVGGGAENSVSLCELTKIAQEVTGKSIQIRENPKTTNVDIPYYVTNYMKTSQTFAWKPQYNVQSIAKEIADWLKTKEKDLCRLF